MFLNVKSFHLGLITLGAAVLLAGCSSVPALGSSNSPGAAAQAGPPTSTPIPTAPAAAPTTYLVQRGDVENLLNVSGRWQPRDQYQLSFPIAGQVRNVNYQQGASVAKGRSE